MGMMATRAVLASAAAVGCLALGACDSSTSAMSQAQDNGMSLAGALACDDFATGVKGSVDAGAQTDLARKVNENAQSDPELADPGKALARNAGTAAWDQSADWFATTCFRLGWPEE